MRIPKYRTRPDRGPAFVCVGGRRVVLPGKANSPESRKAYHELCLRIAGESRKQQPQRAIVPVHYTVGQLILDFMAHAATYYVDAAGKPSAEYENLRGAMRPLAALHAGTPLSGFGVDSLAEVQQAMIDGTWKGADKPWSRGYINSQIRRIRRCFKWGVLHKRVPAEVLLALQVLTPVRKGRSPAPERPPVAPVAEADVNATLPYLSPVLADMVRLQQLTAMRPDSLCRLRPCDLDRSGPVWYYRPPQHKTAYLNRKLVVPIGPRGQAVLAKYLNRDPEAFCFTPGESQDARSAEKRANRKTPLTPSQAARRRRREYRPRYNRHSYRRAVLYGIEAANRARAREGLPPIAAWSPNRIRHSRATVIREKYGLEAAQVSLGHAKADVTQIYAEKNLKLAATVAAEIG